MTIAKRLKMASPHSLPKLSKTLDLAISDSGNLQYSPGSDRYAWAPPGQVAPSVQAEAAVAAAQYEAELRAAQRGHVMHWLVQLGLLAASHMSSGDVKAKIHAYATDLDFPEICYTDATRALAGRRFNWFPSFAELSAFLDEVASPYRIRLDRLRRISVAVVKTEPGPKGWSDMTDEERECQDREMADCMRKLRAVDPIPKQWR